MRSSRERGNELERRAKRELEADGYLVERCNPKLLHLPGGRVIAASHDYYEAFDLCAQLPKHTRWIQVTTDHEGAASERRKKIEAVAPRLDRRALLEVWRYQKHRGWWQQRAIRGKTGAVLRWRTLEKPQSPKG